MTTTRKRGRPKAPPSTLVRVDRASYEALVAICRRYNWRHGDGWAVGRAVKWLATVVPPETT
jgi:hypothetical protein